MKDELYIQCRLQKGTSKQVSYIPERLARIGKFVPLTPESKELWEVTAISYPGRMYSALKQDERMLRDKSNFPSIAEA